jgi:hypothetical protein
MTRIRRLAAALAGLAAALLAFAAAAPAALASLPPLPPGLNKHPPANLPAVPVPAHTVVVGGMPGWKIALIAAMIAVVTAILAVLIDRVREERKMHTSV